MTCVGRDVSGQFITRSHDDDIDEEEGWEGDVETEDDDGEYRLILEVDDDEIENIHQQKEMESAKLYGSTFGLFKLADEVQRENPNWWIEHFRRLYSW